jgi:hypothetical protein
MVRHFETKAKAKKFKDGKNSSVLKIFKKLKGHKNRVKKPFVVCSEIEWLNLY